MSLKTKIKKIHYVIFNLRVLPFFIKEHGINSLFNPSLLIDFINSSYIKNVNLPDKRNIMLSLMNSGKVITHAKWCVNILPFSHRFKYMIRDRLNNKFRLTSMHSDAMNYINDPDEYANLISTQKKIIETRIRNLRYKPLISVIVPVYNVEIRWLKKCIFSVLNQFYENWELCICDDASTNDEIKIVLEQFQKQDSRIKVVYRKTNGHISVASNSALTVAGGEYVTFLDNDDELLPNALFEVVKKVNKRPDTDLIYTDEAKLDGEGKICHPYLKPDWSPHHLNSCMYTLHMFTIKKSLLDEVGWFRSEYDGCQDYDLMLRASKKAQRIEHIPKVLYLWRIIKGSTSQDLEAKPYAVPKMKKLLEEQNPGAEVEDGLLPGTFRVRPKTNNPKVTLVILTSDNGEYLPKFKFRAPNILCNFVKSIVDKTDYENYEILIVFDEKISDETKKFLGEYNYRHVHYQRKNAHFNYSSKVNFSLKYVDSELVVLLNDDMEVISPGWLTAMIEAACMEKVGVVGAKLYSENDTINHAGMAGGAYYTMFHVFRNSAKSFVADHGYTHIIRNYSALTGACMLFRMDDFNKINGFDEKFSIDYNDVDFVLRLCKNLGKYAVYTPYAELYHYENISIKRKKQMEPEVKLFKKKWHNIVRNDPFYNINIPRDEPTYNTNQAVLNKLSSLYFTERKKRAIRIAYNGMQLQGVDGTSRVAANTLDYLKKIDKINSYKVYAPHKTEDKDAACSNFQYIKTDDINKLIASENLTEKYPDIDIFHTTHPFHHQKGSLHTSLLAQAPIGIFQILDLILYKNLTGGDPFNHKLFVHQINLACSWCDKITTISEFTKKDIVNNIGIDPEKIEVIYLGIDKKFKKIIDESYLHSLRTKFELDEKFMFYLGNHLPHKNINGLVKAFAEVKKNSDLPHQLVLSGKIVDSDVYAEANDIVKNNGIESHIKFLGEIPEEDLVGFYNLADLCIYPSLYEGFGLPPLEAMACGIPVVASDKASIPEISGDGACLTDAANANALANSIIEVCKNHDYRNKLIEKGYKRAEFFTWEKTASQTMALYDDLFKKFYDGKLINREKQNIKEYLNDVAYFKNIH